MVSKLLPPVIRYNPNSSKKFYYEDISEELNKFHNATFYYDETNNQRKLSLKNLQLALFLNSYGNHLSFLWLL